MSEFWQILKQGTLGRSRNYNNVEALLFLIMLILQRLLFLQSLSKCEGDLPKENWEQPSPLTPEYPESSWGIVPKGRVYSLAYSPMTRTIISNLFYILCLGSYFSHAKNITILMSPFIFNYSTGKCNVQWQKNIYNIGCLGPVVVGWWEVDCWRR